MKKELLLASSLCIILTACDHQEPKHAEPTPPPPAERVEVGQDRDISDRIRAVLSQENSLSDKAKAVNIVTQDGVVTISGQVESSKEKNKIEKRAKKIEGVKGINNNIEVIRVEEVEKTEEPKE